ncbi:DNA polymerase [Ceratobasidium sp. AG-Ba]|nr:DNA polymerase [Ceratobasidium sp. AG-Ba]
MSLISKAHRQRIEQWLALLSNFIPASLTEHVMGSDSEDEIVIEERGRPVIPTTGRKRQRDSSSPLSESERIVIRRNTTKLKTRKATPYETSTRASSPIGSERAPTEYDGHSESGRASEAGSAATVPRRGKTKIRRQENEPEAELAALIGRIKSCRTNAYIRFSDPVIDYNSGDPPMRHIWTCLKCGKKVTRADGTADTTGFRTHKDRYCKQPSNNDTSLGEHGFRGSGDKMTERDVREFSALWIARCGRPMSIIHDTHLDNLLHPNARRYRPHRTTIAADIKLMYKAMQDQIRANLMDVRGAMHIALDMYASDNGHDYLGIVLFHQEVTDASLKIKRFVLECLNFDGDEHTGDNLAKKLMVVLRKFGLEDRFWGLAGDGASNNGAMLNRLAKCKLKMHKGEKSRIYCICHVLNLAAQQVATAFRKAVPADDSEEEEELEEEDEIEADEGGARFGDFDEDDGTSLSWALDNEEQDDVSSDIGREVDNYDIPLIIPGSEDAIVAQRAGTTLWKLAYFAKKIRFSPYAKKAFVAACIELEIKGARNLRRDQKTRWNSTGNMTSDGERTFPAILKVQRDPRLRIKRHYRFVEGDLVHIQVLNRLFSTFTVVTDVMSRSEVPMLADVTIHFDLLDYVFGQFCEDGKLPLYARHAADRARCKLNEYYSKTDTSDVYRFAILCHPSMRAKYMRMSGWRTNWIENALDALVALYERHYKSGSAPADPSMSTSGVSQFGYSSFASRLYGQEVGNTNASRCPVRDFVNAPIVPPVPDEHGNPVLCNPLAWWYSQRVAGNEWGGFTQLALDVLSMPASASPELVHDSGVRHAWRLRQSGTGAARMSGHAKDVKKWDWKGEGD